MSASPVQRVAFVEIGDEAIEVLSHYARLEEVEPAVLINSRSDSSACRMADLLMIPTLEEIDPSVLRACDLVVVGNADPEVLQAVSEAVAGTEAVIRLAEEVMEEVGQGGEGLQPIVEPYAPTEEKTVSEVDTQGEDAPRPVLDLASLLPTPEAAATQVEPVEESPEPEAHTAPRENSEAGFDLSDLLGQDGDAGAIGFAIDGASPGLTALLDLAVQETNASTGSIMLPEPGGSHLKIVVAAGLPEDLIQKTRPAIGEGVVGEAFAAGEPRMIQAEVPSFAEAGGDERVRIAAAVPILVEGRPVGVLSVNIDGSSRREESDVYGPLTEIALGAPSEILEALDYVNLNLETKERLILTKLDEILARDASFPSRLREAGPVLQRLSGADFAHLFLVDPLEHHLQLISEGDGLASLSAGSQRIDKGFLAWVAQSGRPRIFWVEEEGGETVRGLAFLPVATHRPFGLVVLENLCAPLDQQDGMAQLLAGVVHHIEESLEVEQGVGSQDILGELNMRIADRAGQIELLPVDLRTAPWLEFGIQLLAAEAAIWIPEPGGHPTVAQPQTRQAATLLAQAWDHLEELASWTRERDVAACGASGLGWEPQGPPAPSPWIGIKPEGGEAVLLVLFRGDGETGPPAQIPVRVLSEALRRIANHIEHPAPQEQVPADIGAFEVPMLSRDEFLAALHEEWERSLASQTPLSVTRVRLERNAADEEVSGLREFLGREKRAADRVAEVSPGTFLILSSDSQDDMEGLRQRLEQGWQELRPDLPLRVESISAGDVEGENALQGWLLEDVRRDAA
jgi:GAF domain-containing protein